MLIDFTATHCFEKRHRSIFCFCFLLKRSQNSNVVEAKLILDNESSVPNLQFIRFKTNDQKNLFTCLDHCQSKIRQELAGKVFFPLEVTGDETTVY